MPCLLLAAGVTRRRWLVVDRSSPVEARSSFLHMLGMVIRNICFRAKCTNCIVPTSRTAEAPCPTGRLRRKALTAAVAACGMLDVVVGIKHAHHVCAPVGLGPLVALCMECKSRWSPCMVASANTGPCACNTHLVFTFLAGALTASEVKRGVVCCPEREEYCIMRMKDVLHSDNTLTSLLRMFSLAQTGSKYERACRLGHALLASDPTSVPSWHNTGFPTVSQHCIDIPVVSVKVCTDGAAILHDGRQITTTSFVVMAEGGSGQHTDHHHILVRNFGNLPLHTGYTAYHTHFVTGNASRG